MNECGENATDKMVAEKNNENYMTNIQSHSHCCKH